MATTVADQLISQLIDAGVQRIYGIVGDSLNPVVDAVRRSGGSAKGGIVVAVQRELGVPVKLVGLGEGPDDLAPFDPEAFVDALLG
jgi:fused signal recognition particle receptor